MTLEAADGTTEEQLDDELLGAINRSSDEKLIHALQHIVAVNTMLPNHHEVTAYVREHLGEDDAIRLLAKDGTEFRERCRTARNMLDVDEPAVFTTAREL